MNEIIAAIATANGTGGVAVIRLSGSGALNLATKMFKPSKRIAEIKPNVMYAGNIECENFTDYGFMVYFKSPKSFTGEDVVEFQCHGGVMVARGVLKRAISLGARAAERGEFTRRAFLNGKLSLASAEGMADMINAESLALVRAGSMMYFEKLTAKVQGLQDRLKDIIARIAVETDYPEEDLDGLNAEEISRDISSLAEEAVSLKGTYAGGKKIKSGVLVAICGKPNTGKSSLLNALLGYDKAIVSPVAGTTRDAVEGEIEIGGLKFNLADTAGIRENGGEIESIGIERAKNIISSADIVLQLSDGSEFPKAESRGKTIKVFGKCDIVKPFGKYDVAVSSKTGEGLEELKKLLYASAGADTSSDAAYIVEERHYNALNRAICALQSAGQNLNAVTLDVVSVDLKDAWDALGEITGETASEEIVNEIFAKFCVGK